MDIYTQEFILTAVLLILIVLSIVSIVLLVVDKNRHHMNFYFGLFCVLMLICSIVSSFKQKVYTDLVEDKTRMSTNQIDVLQEITDVDRQYLIDCISQLKGKETWVIISYIVPEYSESECKAIADVIDIVPNLK